MNWYEHHIGDWLKKCGHLSMTEEGCYRRLLDWYYSHERALPLDMKQVYRCARAGNAAERHATQRVLKEFFEPLADGWHQNRADREILRYQNAKPKSEIARASIRERKNRSREFRKLIFSAAREAGIYVTREHTNSQVVELLQTAGVTVPSRHEVTAEVTENFLPVTAEVTADGHASHFPLPTTHGDSYESLAVTPRVSACVENGENGHGTAEMPAPLPLAEAGSACKAMRRAGLADTNPGDPRLLALLQRGCTADALATAAAEAAARSKSWGYALGIAKGRLDDDERARAEVLAWAPPLASASFGERDG